MALHVSAIDARRIAVAAQGPWSRAGASRDRILAAIRALGVVQLDSVNVVCRAHYLPIFARLGAYDRDVLDGAVSGAPRALVEYWGHEASLLPVEMQPLFRWRMDRAARGEGTWKHIARFGKERRAY